MTDCRDAEMLPKLVGWEAAREMGDCLGKFKGISWGRCDQKR
jgi:hypothetical protein